MTTPSRRLHDAMATYFDHSEVTSKMLRTLGNIGPGGMIVADFREKAFRVTHSRTLAHGDDLTLPVFGHGDLTRHLDFLDQEYGTWEDFVAAVDSTAYECMAERIDDHNATRFEVIRMRERLQELGLDMNTAPSYHRRPLIPGHHRGPSVLEVRESYIDRGHPHVSVMLKHPLPEKGQRLGLSLITISDHDRHVKGWPKYVPHQFTANAQAYLIRERVNAHLARIRP
ncbi:hypothetical protein [Nocardiopsis sp. MG754419]|uniref:hypothetical protein n=1 Tax=Nocardiopsis sp. MG754419 TaxID=2259865 RepID=UPI001BAA4A0C|nr:hypothetical protein [Nocardiopsis sp. MG754419]MBR8741423.1 hypothetical protein [Nocardiopsis sp. MG754419]